MSLHYNLTIDEKNIIKEFKLQNNHVCSYCCKRITDDKDLTVDHKIPISRGGATTETNLTIACLKCNREKDNMTDKEYMRFKEIQLKIYESYEVSKLIMSLQKIFEDITNISALINSEFNISIKNVENIEVQIAKNKFNACEGYRLAKQLKETINKRNELYIKQEAINNLHSFVGNFRKPFSTVSKKIYESIAIKFSSEIKTKCIKNYRSTTDSSNVILINDRAVGALEDQM